MTNRAAVNSGSWVLGVFLEGLEGTGMTGMRAGGQCVRIEAPSLLKGKPIHSKGRRSMHESAAPVFSCTTRFSSK